MSTGASTAGRAFTATSASHTPAASTARATNPGSASARPTGAASSATKVRPGQGDGGGQLCNKGGPGRGDQGSSLPLFVGAFIPNLLELAFNTVNLGLFLSVLVCKEEWV